MRITCTIYMLSLFMDDKKEYNIYTMCRSGNHAIIFWLINNMDGYTHKIDGCTYWNPGKGLYFYNNCNHLDHFFNNFYNVKICSYEDTFGFQPEGGINKKAIIILRDFLNMICSRYKKYGDQLGLNWSYLQDLDKIIDLWKVQAKMFNNKDMFIGISYNSWLTDKNYRDNICKEFGLENKDQIDHISDIGEGSSFTGLETEKNKKNYLRRFNDVDLPSNIIEKILSDKELIQLNKQIFDIDIEEQLS